MLLNRGAADPGVFDDITNSSGLNRDRMRFQTWEEAGMLFGPSVQDFSAGFADLDGDGAATSTLFWTIPRCFSTIYTTLLSTLHLHHPARGVCDGLHASCDMLYARRVGCSTTPCLIGR